MLKKKLPMAFESDEMENDQIEQDDSKKLHKNYKII